MQPAPRHSAFLIHALALATLTTILLVLLASLASARSTVGSVTGNHGTLDAGDWPMYGHNNQRTSYNSSANSINLNNIGQLTQTWQVNIGLGATGYPAFSGPIVSGGRVFVADSAGADNFASYNAYTGAPIWSTFIGYNPDECFRVHIGSTPAISGTTIVIGGGDAAYYGINADTGEQLWRVPLNQGPSAFAWTSPLLANGQAYVGIASDCDNPSVQGAVLALNLRDGSVTARRTIVPDGMAGGGVWNSATLSPDGSKIVVVTGEDYEGYNGPSNRALMVLDAQTLDVLGYHQVGALDEDQDWASTPIIFTDSLGRTLVAAAHKNGRFYVYNLDNVSAGPIWNRYTGGWTGMVPAYDPTAGTGGTLFFAGGLSLFAVNPTTGEDRWPPVYIGEARGSLAIANGLIFANSNGALRVINDRTGETARLIRPLNEGPGMSGPTIADGIVYWVSGAYLNAWSLPGLPTVTAVPAITSTPAPTNTPTPPCIGNEGRDFRDVCASDPFENYIHNIYLSGIVSGYPCGGPGEPCVPPTNMPYYRPGNSTTRGQMAKIVVLASGLATNTVGGPHFEDVPVDHTFYSYVETAYNNQVIAGYPCGGPGEPCNPPFNLPYFRPNATVTRGQLTKMVALAFNFIEPVSGQTFEDVAADHTFYTYTERLAAREIIGGYPCGNPEPCVPPDNRPYFRSGNWVTRAQTSKFIDLARTQPSPTPTATIATATTTPEPPLPTATETTNPTTTVTITPEPTVSTVTPTETPTRRDD